MAYAAVASLSHAIHLLLNYHQQSISPKFKDQIISLHKHTIFLQSFLEDAPDRANNWEETIREVTDRAEDMIELLLSDSLMESTLGSSKSKRELHYDLNELERVAEEMESIANRVKGGRHTVTMGGSDHELMDIISRLREGSSSALEVIAFVGMRGMGKTTLARNAYNNPLIVEHFDVRAWSTVSQDYSRRGIILDLLRFMNKSSAGSISDSEDELISGVYKILKGKKYLIVLDDIWSLEALKGLRLIDRIIGDKRRSPLMPPDDGNGSRIILTTRLYSVAVTAAHTHKMRFMSVDKTWDLLRARIFKGDPCPSQLEHLGKMIAISCRGHPLSIDVVSGILAAADQAEALWEDISENIKIASEVDDILYLSYTYLPHHLRPCFLYLASLPEDHDIPVSKLVKLWVAEGFLNGSESKSYEEIGEEHVEELVQRGLVSISKRKSNGRIKSIIIHDLMRDLCLRQARIDNFILDVSRFGRFDRQVVAMKLQPCRRVSKSIYGNDILEGVYGSTIRTIMLYLNNVGLGVRCSIGNVRLLRILDLSNAYNYDLPEEVFDLFHLRYLAFYCGFSVSEAISNLKNLQTLIICPREEGGMFDNLPEGIWRMPQLRHLFMFLFELPNQKGATSFALENLQTLSRVVDFICSRDNLKMIPNLKKLDIFYTKKFRDVVEDYELHNLVYLQKLEILKIEMDWCLGEQHKMSCALPPTLKKLSLSSVGFPWEDMKIVGSLPSLQVLKLIKFTCIGETWKTSEGGFSQLTFLLIEESNLENWITKSSHFPRLECLVFHCCLRLLRVPNDIGKVPTLELIEFDDKNHSLLSSANWIQKDRQSLGYDPLQIRVV